LGKIVVFNDFLCTFARNINNKPSKKLTNILKYASKSAGAIVVAAFMIAGQAVQAQINTEQVINVGRNAMYFEDYVLSIQYFNQAIAAKPYLAKPYFYRSIAKLNLDDYRGAEEDASKAIELNPFITDAWEVRGVARQNLGNEHGAIEDYAHALSLVPFNRQLMFNMAVAQTGVEDYAAADSTFTELLKHYPGYSNGYLGRARLNLARTDTVAAIKDIDKALEIDGNSFNAHTMRADIAIHQGKENYPEAIKHIDNAIKLQPRLAGLYVNRAYLRYSTDDWFGAMSDYDYAIELEPMNKLALFNRGLLEMEVNANDKALADFTKVLKMDPSDVRARYNRSVIYSNLRQFNKAIADVNYVIEAFPDFPTGYYMRSEYYRLAGNLNSAINDRNKAKAIGKKLRPTDGKVDGHNAKEEAEDPEELARREFATLLTVEDNTDFREEYNNTAIRGKVQDRNINIEIEPMMELTFYASSSELRQNSYYIKEIDELNATRALRFAILVSNDIPQLQDSELIDRHFKSIEYYNSYISTHTPRTIDYIGRALDFITVHDYTSAILDLNRAIALSPDYSPAYMLRAQALARQLESSVELEEQPSKDGAAQNNRGVLERKKIDEIIDDLETTIKLSPRNAFAWFNKGNMLVKRGDYDKAIEAYGMAISIKSDLAEAYYNRGYLYLKNGNRQGGVADLSKAGELGVVSAYNLMKRISQ
jgi:tetratricopeptide (TPR) repeat protein